MLVLTSDSRPPLPVQPKTPEIAIHKVRSLHMEHFPLLLDALRGMACLMVVLYHTREIVWIGSKQYLSAPPAGYGADFLIMILFTPFALGGSGVAIFFVLSGYLIHRATVARERRIDTLSFYKRRFVRIYPVLFSALVLTAVIDAASAAFGNGERFGTHTATQFICNLGAAQGLLCGTFGSNGPLWSLAIEIQFYLLYPALIYIRGKIGTRLFIVLIFVITLGGILLESSTKLVFFPQYLLSWWMGAYVAEPIAARKTSTRQLIFIGALLLLFASISSALRFNLMSFYLFSACTAVAIGLMPAVPPPSGRSVAILFRSLAAVGGWSYSVYILHVPLLILLRTLFLDVGKSEFAVAVPLAAAFSIGICYLYFKMVEFYFIAPKHRDTYSSSLLG